MGDARRKGNGTGRRVRERIEHGGLANRNCGAISETMEMLLLAELSFLEPHDRNEGKVYSNSKSYEPLEGNVDGGEGNFLFNIEGAR